MVSRSMQQELIDKLRGLTAQDLRLWTDSRYIARGRSYLSCVGEPKWSDGSIVAKVRGTQTYTTELFLDAHGELEAEMLVSRGGTMQARGRVGSVCGTAVSNGDGVRW